MHDLRVFKHSFVYSKVQNRCVTEDFTFDGRLCLPYLPMFTDSVSLLLNVDC